MGGAATRAAGSVIQPWADSAAFFATDTVSGQVILRGYAEDDQRVERLDLNIGITISEEDAASAQDGDTLNFKPPVTGLLKVPSALTGKVYFTDSLDLYRHRVEWAYIWDTESIPANFVVGNTTVHAVSLNGYSDASNTGYKQSALMKAETPTEERHLNQTYDDLGATNPNFPLDLYKYNSVGINIRPYVTGFKRNKTAFYHDTRSLQGWSPLVLKRASLLPGLTSRGMEI